MYQYNLIGFFIPSNNSILQWNINSLKSRFARLEFLINLDNICIIALQETKNPAGKLIRIRGYEVYKKDRNARGGGVLLAVHRNIPSTPLPINSHLEIVACTVHFEDLDINICNVYLPEHSQIDYDTITNLFNSIPDLRSSWATSMLSICLGVLL